MAEQELRLAQVALAQALARRDELLARVTAADREIPGYASLPAVEIGRFVDLLLPLGVELLRSGRSPGDADRRRIHDFAVRRSRQGVDASSMFLATQLGVTEFLAVFDEEAAALGVSAEEVLAIHDHVGGLSNITFTVLTAAFRELDATRATGAGERRRQSVHALSLDQLSDSERMAHARVCELDPAAELLALSARVSDPADREALVQELVRAASTTAQRAVVVADGDELIGIAAKRPELPETALVVGAGSAGRLADLPRSLQEARGAHDVAYAVGRTGVVDYELLGTQALARSADLAGDALDRVYLAGVDAAGSQGAEIIRTVAAFLACDQNVDAASAQLHVHRNTVHYRLRRFRELTELDLGRTDDLVMTWWLLSRRGESSGA